MIITYNPHNKVFRFFRYGIEREYRYDVCKDPKDFDFYYHGICQYDFSHIKNGMFVSPYTLDKELKNNHDIDYNNYYVNFFCKNVKECPIVEKFGLCDREYQISNNDYNVCFTPDDAMILYKSDLNYTPERYTYSFKTLTKKNKTICKKWGIYETLSPNKWCRFYKEDHYEIQIWKFKSEKDYVVFPWVSLHRQLYNFAPEIFNNGLTVMLSPYREESIKLPEFLYNLEPFNTSRDYDVEPEKRKELNAEKERKEKERKEYEERLEVLKKTPGYCCRCGGENAGYVENPYYKEMYGSTKMEWLCSDCYDDMCGDI